jgi:hypothetical protein
LELNIRDIRDKLPHVYITLSNTGVAPLMKICGEAKKINPGMKINHPFAASPQKLPLPGRQQWSS